LDRYGQAREDCSGCVVAQHVWGANGSSLAAGNLVYLFQARDSTYQGSPSCHQDQKTSCWRRNTFLPSTSTFPSSYPNSNSSSTVLSLSLLSQFLGIFRFQSARTASEPTIARARGEPDLRSTLVNTQSASSPASASLLRQLQSTVTNVRMNTKAYVS
jgi:hypothetical protein